jgi:uncharacterized protein YecT (DUF1311 family)
MPDISTDDTKRPRHSQRWQRRKGRHGQPIRFSSLIETIRDEGRAYRKEEQREDQGKRFREWITIILITMTFAAVCYQVYEMIKVYEPIREQAEAAKSAANATKRAADAATTQSEIATKQAEISARQAENSDKALVQSQRAWIGPRDRDLKLNQSLGKRANSW